MAAWTRRVDVRVRSRRHRATRRRHPIRKPQRLSYLATPSPPFASRWSRSSGSARLPIENATSRTASPHLMADTDIAVVGMACRLPGARDPAEFWQLLRDGREARQEFTDDQLRAAGVPEAALRDPQYVKAGMVLADIDRFDAPFFGFSPRDAAIMDPQHRVFLEVAWEAFENAGHVPERFAGRVGVFAGCGMNTYLLHNILTNRELVQQIGMFLIRHTGNDKDFLATRVSYQFDLRGPSVNVLTACSTSLVAIHQAAQSLLAGECDLALAGGVTILVPQDLGYRYEDGEILSPDGHCRAFDADSKGTIFGSGAGAIVLRRLQDAIADGDQILAVLAGSAVNNDGARKVGYLAPSVDGYAEVVAEALALANIPADQVQYLEAHGTGTPVGDPIEVEALTQAFRVTSQARGTCGIGSVKTNIGHLDTAAGIAGFLKVVLAMQHGRLPASLNWRTPNPLIDFAASPFTVVREARDWPAPPQGRIAGVSSLGVGGTNAHVIVRQGPAPSPAEPSVRRAHLLPLSGKSVDAVLAAAGRMATFLDDQADTVLADVGFTAQAGRKAFAQRVAVAGATASELAAALRAPSLRNQIRKASERAVQVVFLFPGGGAQYPGMGKGLYEHEPEFRRAADECLQALPPAAGAEVRELLFGDAASAMHGERLERPSLALPALFVVEYATARTLLSFGIESAAMLGHSMGEYVAACLAGTFTVAQGMQIVLLRGQLFEQVSPGAMLTVSLPVDQVAAMAEEELSLAAANAPTLAVVAGTVPAIDRLQRRLEERGIDCQRLRIAVAAHSHLLDPILERFAAGLRTMRFQPAQKPFLSNVTGDWIDPQRAASPEYWVEHLRRTVRFQDAAARLLERNDCVFVEVGPGKALTSLIRMHERGGQAQTCTSLPHAKDTVAADVVLLDCVGRLWQFGVEVDWRRFHGDKRRRRVPLPTYPFQRQRHWLEPGATPLAAEPAVVAPPPRLPVSAWLRQPVYEPCDPGTASANGAAHWFLFGDGAGVAGAFASHVHGLGCTVAMVRADGDLESALAAVPVTTPLRILWLAGLDSRRAIPAVQELTRLCQALGRRDRAATTRIVALTHGAVAVGDEAIEWPDGAAIGAFLRIAVAEYSGLQARAIDVDAAALAQPTALVSRIASAVEAAAAPAVTALRQGRWLAPQLAAVAESGAILTRSPWRREGVYLLSGGLTGVGLLLAEHLATQFQARLVLMGRRGLPRRGSHDEWLLLRGGDRVSDTIRRLRAMAAAGARVEVIAGDVADPAAVQAAVARAQEQFGALHGVVHCAGVLDDGLIQGRTPAQIENVMAAKVRGAQVLDQATASAMPELFVLFASVSGLSAIPGQGDYAAANAFLDAFAAWRRAQRPGRTLAIDWGVWAGTGMLAERPAVAAVPADSPLLGKAQRQDGELTFTTTVSPVTHWELAEHRLADQRALLPGTAWLQRLAAAGQAALGQGQVTLRRFEIRAPLLVGDTATATLRATARPEGPGQVLAIESLGADGRRTVHATALALPGGGGDVPFPDWWRESQALPPGRSQQARHVRFGPRWQNVVRTAARDGLALGELQLPAAFTQDLATHPLHPALLDMAIGIALPLLDRGEDLLFVPVGCDEVRIHGSLPARVVLRVQQLAYDEHARLGSFDIVVATPSGIPLLELRSLQVYGVVGGALAAASAAPPSLAPATRAAVASSAPVGAIAALVSRGITGPEGFNALAAAWASGLSQVIVSPFEVADAAAWLRRPPERPRPAPKPAAVATAAPTATTAPRDEIEKRLCALWQELLGVPEADVDVDFFEAGGHSLLAVRLFARLHRDHGVDLELATLLQATTPRKLATVVRQHLNLPEPATNATAAALPARKFQFLVQIHGDGARPPLYLVHGAGGNVLGFRDLAHYLGADQPVFGLQARGVDGRTPPHESIEAMARDYLAEIRQVQPTGPYYLGGYSGGGCVALEMAQQLLAAGEVVPFVGMIDTWAPDAPERGKLARLGIHVGRLLRRGPAYPFSILRQRRAAKQAAKEHQQKVAAGGGGAIAPELRGHELQNAFERAFFGYRPRPYDGPVWLFSAEREDHTKYVHTADLGWGRYLPQIATTQCPGDHFSMCTEPNVQLLCARYRSAMDQAMLAAASRR
ncbi:MAG: SDR family oxidoreductase [Planctomycetes bacterium]|nr:SDR family oxidoreductase [Planctomycetota bacterium]